MIMETSQILYLRLLYSEFSIVSINNPGMTESFAVRFPISLSHCSMLVKRHWLIPCSIAVKTHHDYSNCYKGKYLNGACQQVRNLVYCFHERKPGSMQVDMVLESTWVLLPERPDPQAAGREQLTLGLVWAFQTSNSQWYTSAKKATSNPSNPTKPFLSWRLSLRDCSCSTRTVCCSDDLCFTLLLILCNSVL